MINIYTENRRERERAVDNGFIYPLFDTLIRILCYINIIELLKSITTKISNHILKNMTDDNKRNRIIRKNKNLTIDGFIVGKFLLIYILWKNDISNIFTLISIWYLLIMNIFTYFYHHVWIQSAMLNMHLTMHRVRRRFINLFISLFYMIVTYGYFYSIPYKLSFEAIGKISYQDYFFYSISNSFASSYDKIKPITNFGESLKLSQLIMVFIFITIILSRSVPEIK